MIYHLYLLMIYRLHYLVMYHLYLLMIYRLPSRDLSPVPSHDLSPSPSRDLSPVPSHDLSPSPSRDLSPVPSHDLSPSPSRDLSPVPSHDLLPSPSRDLSPVPSRDLSPTLADDLLPSSLQCSSASLLSSPSSCLGSPSLCSSLNISSDSPCQDSSFDEPLYNNAPLSKKESWESIMAFSVENNLTYTATDRLIELLHNHCPMENKLPPSRQKLRKYFLEDNVISKSFCSMCCSEVPLKSKCKRRACRQQKAEFCQLLILDFKEELKRMYEGTCIF